MAPARPMARARKRLRVGPSSTLTSSTNRLALRRWWLFSALATALLRALATATLAACGVCSRVASARITVWPRRSAVTWRTLRLLILRLLALATTLMIYPPVLWPFCRRDHGIYVLGQIRLVCGRPY